MRKIIFLLLFCVIACSKKQEADVLVVNALVYTVNENFDTAESFAVKDGKFIAVGTTDEITSNYTAPEVIDLEGQPVFPGFIDAHCHFYGLGMNQQVVNLVGTKSFNEVIERVVAFQKNKPKAFIRGRGWDQNDWEVKTFPTKHALDSLFPDTPVVLERIDGHAYLVNQKALDMAGITKATKMDGGEVVLKDGEVTGVLVDAPMSLVDAVMPKPTLATQVEALKTAQKLCFSNGLTTVNDAGLSKQVIMLIDSLQKNNELAMRVYAMVSNSPENLDYFLNRGIIKTNKLNVRSVKVYGDGALGSRGAALKQPYSDHPNHFGAMVTSPDDIVNLAERIAASDYQMNTHAIGDSANVVVLKAYKNALKGTTDRRWKIEHAQIVDIADFDYFKEGIIPSVQPTHATSDMYWAEDRVGPHRIKGAYAFKTLLNKAGIVALGTDFPVEQVSPFLTFYAAVARQDTTGYPDGGFLPNEKLSREEALKGMTIWAAYSNFEENEKGSIEPGKFADFIVLNKDIMKIPYQDIPKTQVLRTYLDGKRVW